MNIKNLAKGFALLGTLFLVGCGGGGGGSSDVPTDTSLVFSAFPPGYFDGSYSASYTLTGSSSDGENFTATLREQSGTTTLFNAQPVMTVNVVGFGVKDKSTQQQLTEVAAETGGAFFYASETGELKQAMAKALAAEFVVLDMQGNEVHKGQVGGDKIQLPVGQYRVEVDTNPKIVKEISIEADEAEELVLESVKVSMRKKLGPE